MRHHLLSIFVSNHFGVLMRVTTIFSRRICNIKSLTVAETENPEVSRITIVFEAEDSVATQIERTLGKQEDVLSVKCLTIPDALERELALVRVRMSPRLQMDMPKIQTAYAPRVLRQDGDSMVMEFTGDVMQTERFVKDMAQYDMLEICRTGAAALGAG